MSQLLESMQKLVQGYEDQLELLAVGAGAVFIFLLPYLVELI